MSICISLFYHLEVTNITHPLGLKKLIFNIFVFDLEAAAAHCINSRLLILTCCSCEKGRTVAATDIYFLVNTFV
jgi:hypothetical protein